LGNQKTKLFGLLRLQEKKVPIRIFSPLIGLPFILGKKTRANKGEKGVSFPKKRGGGF